MKLSNLRRHLTVLNLLFALFAVIYAYFFYESIGAYWFKPNWTTDDALQQSFPFHKVHNPHLFKGDLITEAMEGYLAPLHYWISYGITWLTGDPMMMGHWVMLIQLVGAVGFFFLAIHSLAGFIPACFSVAWLLHTRHIMQRLTGGLPRGWAAPVIAAYLYFLCSGRHKGVLATILLGCLLHPPATFLVALSYGFFLVWQFIWPATRSEAKRNILRYIILSPVLIATTFTVVRRPEHIGQMVSYETAASMPEFARPYGRFPFVPLREVGHELRSFGFHAFKGRFFNPHPFFENNMWWMVTALAAAIAGFGVLRGKATMPAVLMTFLAGTLTTYFASRAFAFKLYVPNRHLQFPMGFFFISFFSVGLWRLFHRQSGDAASKDASWRSAWPPAAALVGIAALVYAGSGTGLYGGANFNWTLTKKGHVFSWLRQNTPHDALVAGHPTHIDAVPLFGMRTAYVTTEVSHPFYDKYYAEIRRRLEVSLRAHYAKDLTEFLMLLEPEGIDYFIFQRDKFYPEELAKAYYFPPFVELLRELGSRHHLDYAYRELPRDVDEQLYPFVPFRDDFSVLVDVGELRKYLADVESMQKRLIGGSSAGS